MDQQQEIFEALKQQWELGSNKISAEEIRKQIAIRISRMIERDPETFFQLMYRLDIPENKLITLLMDINAPDVIAEAIYNRQVSKINSRSQYKAKNDNIDPELQW